ncbi:protein neprosin-like [Corylus avellana]|uniref:protein neprosin-like n=1 Tax=Corylus avellana TaxID=13451 RepID=UPI00286A06BF|nr:protein neprosin-like [Corylus avellana]
MEPSSIPNVTNRAFNNVELSQGWLENGECPEGTIPIRQARADEYDVHRAIPPVAHRKKFNISLDYDYNRGHEYAVVDLRGGNYYGAHASINVWNPATYTGEISIAQIWLASGPKNLLNTIEAGWLVNSRDKQTRFFIYWTRDGYQRTGCYNLDCPGFVQVNRRFAIGSPIKPVSSYNSKQYEIGITIYKNKGHWWLRVQDQVLGYWPHLIYTYLASSATGISWGGEIYNKGEGGHHTSTQMGSGHFPSEGFGKASYFRNIQYMDYTGKFNDPDQGLVAYATKPSCYSISVSNNKNGAYGTNFYFGGPGYSPICPS